MHESPILAGIGSYSDAQGRDFPRHSHENWEMAYYTHGSVVAVVGDRRIPVEPGTLVATPPRVPHAELASGSWGNIYFEIIAPPEAAWPLVVHDGADGRILRVIEAMLDEAHDPGGEMASLLLRELDLLLLRRAETMRAVRPPRGSSRAPSGSWCAN